MANQQVDQGTLNRLLGSVVYANNAQLNVIAPNLAKPAISLAFTGDAGELIGTLTGGVTSPEPYQIGNVRIHLLRTQAFADAYKAQIETDNRVGSVNIVPDVTTLSAYQLENCILLGADEQTFDGTNPGMVIRLMGIYYVNAALFAS